MSEPPHDPAWHHDAVIFSCTSMQWSADRNAGFSNADSAALCFPLITDPPFGYQTINVAREERTSNSLLQWTRAIARLRSRYRAFGRGTFEPLDPQNRRVLVFLRRTLNGRDFYWFRLMPPGGPQRLGAVAQVGA